LKWNRIGTFNFSGNASDVVIISNNVDTTTYICADAIRITSSDSTISTASNPRYIAEEFNLVQNYPNPFNPATRIRYLLAGRMPAAVSLKVFDVLGTSIVTLVDEEQAAGTYETIFDAAALPSGVYFCELRAGGLKQVKKMLLLR
jgi:hypothetical protein